MRNKKQLVTFALVLSLALCGAGIMPNRAQANEPFLGEIRIFAFNFAPKGWALCNGQLLPINQNQALFSLLGTSYGGNGQTNFALPDLRGRVAIGRGEGHSVGDRGGQEYVTLTSAALPAHMHPIPASLLPGTLNLSDASAVPAVAQTLDRRPINMYSDSYTDMLLGITYVGGNQPHDNMQPYLVVNYCIALQGIFPSPN